MSLLSWIRNYSNGDTASQNRARAARANARSGDYMLVVQWVVENTDFMPLELTGYDDVLRQEESRYQEARRTGGGFSPMFRPGHKNKLLEYRSDILRKISHVAGTDELVMKGFLRADQTLFCIFVGSRDRTQNYKMLKPYWFLSPGETENGFKAVPVNMINTKK